MSAQIAHTYGNPICACDRCKGANPAYTRAEQGTRRSIHGLIHALDAQLEQHGYDLVTGEQEECLFDPGRAVEARGMVMDLIDRVLAEALPITRQHLHDLLSIALPIDPNDPDEGTAAYGAWDTDRIDPNIDLTMENRELVPENGPSHPAFKALTQPIATPTANPFGVTPPKGDAWMQPLIDEFHIWIVGHDLDPTTCGDAEDILVGILAGKHQHLDQRAQNYLREFVRRWDVAEAQDAKAEQEAEAQRAHLKRLGMDPVEVQS